MLKCTFFGGRGWEREEAGDRKLLHISEKGGMFVLREQAQQDRLCSETSADPVVLVEFHML